MESLDQEEIKQIQLELQSSGTQLVQKSPKTPWVQGSAENAVKLTKKVIPTKYSFTIFQGLRLMEFVEWTLNNRPIGLQSDLEILTPNSYKPIHSNTNPPTPFENYPSELSSAREKFSKDWFELYYCTI